LRNSVSLTPGYQQINYTQGNIPQNILQSNQFELGMTKSNIPNKIRNDLFILGKNNENNLNLKQNNFDVPIGNTSIRLSQGNSNLLDESAHIEEKKVESSYFQEDKQPIQNINFNASVYRNKYNKMFPKGQIIHQNTSQAKLKSTNKLIIHSKNQLKVNSPHESINILTINEQDLSDDLSYFSSLINSPAVPPRAIEEIRSMKKKEEKTTKMTYFKPLIKYPFNTNNFSTLDIQKDSPIIDNYKPNIDLDRRAKSIEKKNFSYNNQSVNNNRLKIDLPNEESSNRSIGTISNIPNKNTTHEEDIVNKEMINQNIANLEQNKNEFSPNNHSPYFQNRMEPIQSQNINNSELNENQTSPFLLKSSNTDNKGIQVSNSNAIVHNINPSNNSFLLNSTPQPIPILNYNIQTGSSPNHTNLILVQQPLNNITTLNNQRMDTSPILTNHFNAERINNIHNITPVTFSRNHSPMMIKYGQPFSNTQPNISNSFQIRGKVNQYFGSQLVYPNINQISPIYSNFTTPMFKNH